MCGDVFEHRAKGGDVLNAFDLRHGMGNLQIARLNEHHEQGDDR